MSCTVTLCDSGFAPVTDGTIVIDAFKPPTLLIDSQSNNPLAGGEWGAMLTVGPSDIYDVVIDTKGTNYAPPVLQNLSGAGTPQLDVVLLSTAGATSVGSSGPPPRGADALGAFVERQVWEEEAKRAILIVLCTARYVKRVGQPKELLQLGAYLEWMLRGLRIDPDIL
jgi:hypothetical protein